MGVFQQKLKRHPLSTSFPNYTREDDVNRAAEYILGLFKSANRANLLLHPHVAEPDDYAKMHRVFGVVQEHILQDALGLPAVKIIPIRNSMT
jgi:hypothetical protein